MMVCKEAIRGIGKITRRHCLQKRSNVRKKEIMSMVIEALAEKENKEESAARSASKKLLELCRGAKKKSVGMIGLNLLSPDFVPSLPKPTFKKRPDAP
jgi:hypothetical protein